MVKISLQLKAEVENVSEISADGEDFRWYLKMKCCNCGDVPDGWQYVTQADKTALKSGRGGEVSLVIKCKLCQRENSLDIVDTKKSISLGEEQFVSVVTFDCRGVEPIDFSPRGGWRVKASESKTTFRDVSLAEKEWVDYDDEAKLSVAIYNLQHQFIKTK